uniref:LRAT domain-containing protein n=1 Tax=Panagrellus redivivus TaxID=6233 RepID=A0A7E4ZY51_PANRE
MLDNSTDANFVKNVNKLLANESMAYEVYRKYGTTPLGQNFVFVVSSLVWYAVRFIVETDGRVVDPSEKDSTSVKLLYRKQFARKYQIDDFVNSRFGQLAEGEYGNEFNETPTKIPKDCVEYPDKYLKTGDHVRSDHDGIYIGDGLVVHFHSDIDGTEDDTEARMNAIVCIATVEEFKANYVLKIVDHCIRRRHHADIKAAADENLTDLWPMPTIYSAKAMSKRYRKAPHREAVFGYLCAVGVPRVAPHLEVLGYYDTNDI